MSLASPIPGPARDWHSVFSDVELLALQAGIPAGIHSAQARTSSADIGYADPDRERDVYGVGMSKAAPKDIRVELQNLKSYREVRIARTSRRLMFVGRALIFPLRVGEKMRRNRNQLWLRSFSPSRQEYFTAHSSARVEPADVTLFDDGDDAAMDAAGPQMVDALRRIEEDEGRSELFVPFYSSSPHGVGQIMWAPARLDGRYLRFIDPETLSYRKLPKSAAEATSQKPQPAAGFAEQPRPRTQVRRRAKPNHPTKQDQ